MAKEAADAVAEQQNANAGGEAVLGMQDEPTEVVIPEEEDESTEVVIHDDEAVFKEEDAPIQFIITDQIDQRDESNVLQEVEVTHYFITDNVYGAETELRNEFKCAEATEDVRGDCYAEDAGKDGDTVESDRKFRIPTLEGATGRSNESESVEPHRHVHGRIRDELEAYQIAEHNVLGNGELKYRVYGSVIATEGSEFGR